MSRARKRSAPPDGDDETEDSPESSPPRRASNKRRRTSDESSVPQDTFSDQDGRGSTPPSDIDSNSNDEEEDEEILMHMTQALEARKERGELINEPAEYGILEEVQVVNFMCHKGFAFKLGPLINFICGKNGSGKSAILTAIILCLGGKASATNRGARLQNFIKEGEDHATIVCKIKNQGENAYMPELYGATIQVERHIQRNGSSGFKLKSEKGRVISTRKSDLEEICDHMMLQIENPLAVLSQDQARQFLSGSSPTEKYKFFMKGVQLEQLDQDYRLIEEQLDNISARIREREPDLKVLKDRHERAATKLAIAEKHEGMRAKLREQTRQLTWAQVAAKEDIRDEYLEEIRKTDDRIAVAQAKAEELDAVFQQSDGALSVAKEAYEAAKAEVDRLNVEKAEEKAQYAEIKKSCLEAQAEQRQIGLHVKTAEETIAKRKEAIGQEEHRLAELDGGGAARRIAERDLAEDAVMTLKQKQREHLERRQSCVDDVARMQKLLDDSTQAKKQEDARVTELENLIKSLKENRDSQDLALHKNMRVLLQAIQQERGFQERPVGPIAKHVRLLKPEWSAILETVFGKALAGFIVTSKRDETLLSSIMRRNGCGDLPIFITNHSPLDVESHLPDARYQTILSVLEIDHELVKKQLVIANQIEQSILIPDVFEATQILRNGGTPLPRVRRCYCLGQKVKEKGFMLSYRGGTVAQDPTHGWTKAPRMKTDVGENIRLQELTLEERKAERLRAEQEFSSARNRHLKAKQALKAHDNHTAELRIQVQKAEDRVEQLEDAIKEDHSESGKLEQLRQELQKAEDELKVHENSFEDSVNELDELKKKLRAAHDKCGEVDGRIQAANGVAEKAKEAAQAASRKREYDLYEKNNAFAVIEEGQNDRGSLERRLQEIEEHVASFTEQARAVCERVNLPEGDTYESLKKKHEKLRAEYEKWKKQVGDPAELAAEASKCSKAFRKAEDDMRTLESLQEQLRRTLTNRKMRWERFRQHITARSRAGFIMKLSERGFRGKLHVDHVKKVMDIAVEPDITRRSGEGRSAKTLSGGEKSFSQICLLLSIWEAMGVPIRCLDEFDVFMDAVNRNTSVKLLIDGARHSTSGQFILISPGTQSDIPIADDVNRVE
ncbi:Structural maintenance of chromosomes protein 6 [Cladophialophora carrionii]|uniref:Structural maintenance of chromosomes protein 6 n=1 Tax=Cladophialophora carrionii TaxID=86049 RepID=A0A1C1CGS1_9EURO|nr:Structural maintenance of chromosomes protein 6 [Cladophialophora carrionii]